jgi:hypothetical protein
MNIYDEMSWTQHLILYLQSHFTFITIILQFFFFILQLCELELREVKYSEVST